MKKIAPEEILDNETYLRERDALRERAMKEKARRRVHVGDHLTFLFETADILRVQVQEMLRIEGRTSEKDVRHEVDTYNELLGDEGELGCTLMIEIEDATERDRLLRAWKGLMDHVHVRLPDGTRVGATFDPRQVGDDRLSSVQYLKFPVGGVVPAAVGVDSPELTAETELSPEQRAALEADLAA